MGMQKTAQRLQTALAARGRDVSITQRTFYSRAYGRVLTKYVVRERDPVTHKSPRLLETYRLQEVVQLLAELYQDSV